MVSFAAQRVGSSMLSFELASRSRSLAFTVVSVERRQRQQPSRQAHTIPRNALFQQSSQQPQRPRQPSHFRSISNQPALLQQTASTPQSFASSQPPPPPSSSQQSSTPPRSATPTNTSSATSRPPSTPTSQESITDIASAGLSDAPPSYEESASDSTTTTTPIDWARSFHGLSTQPFSPETSEILLQPVDPADVEIKPDGIIYLPEIKYRRILNKAFGPGGWGLAPRSETIVTARFVTREYALLAHGRLVSVARGEQEYFDREGIPTATEGCKSNALMRCCKDLGVASELWDPRFIRRFMKEWGREVWVEHQTTKRRRKIAIRKDDAVQYPYKETK